MAENELIEEAKNRYPIGTKFISDCSKENGYLENEYEITHDLFTVNKMGIQGKSNGYIPFVYYRDKWAEIVSYPEGYIPKSINLLQKIEIW